LNLFFPHKIKMILGKRQRKEKCVPSKKGEWGRTPL